MATVTFACAWPRGRWCPLRRCAAASLRPAYRLLLPDVSTGTLAAQPLTTVPPSPPPHPLTSPTLQSSHRRQFFHPTNSIRQPPQPGQASAKRRKLENQVPWQMHTALYENSG